QPLAADQRAPAEEAAQILVTVPDRADHDSVIDRPIDVRGVPDPKLAADRGGGELIVGAAVREDITGGEGDTHRRDGTRRAFAWWGWASGPTPSSTRASWGWPRGPAPPKA